MSEDRKKLSYNEKPDYYFSNARIDYVNQLPDSTESRVLEIGCGAGATGEMALNKGKCIYYAGIDIDIDAANIAKNNLSEVIIGDVEDISFPWEEETFDVLICSEVLEHLVDPWEVMAKLVKLLKPGGLVMASSPNVSHYNIILNLLKGKWELVEVGVMDKTHLRWFTPTSFRCLFEDCGITVEKLGPITKNRRKASIVNFFTFNRFSHLFMTQISIFGRKR